MARIELGTMINALPGPGEEPITMGAWSRRLSIDSPYSKAGEQRLRDRYYRYRDAGLLEGWVTVEERTERGRPRYFFSRTVPESYSPGGQVVELVTRPVVMPHPPRTPLIPLRIDVGDRFRGI